MSDLHIDRESFILYTKGIYFENRVGVIKFCNERECELAEKELYNKKTVVLMVNNKPISTLSYDEEDCEFVEKFI